MNILLVDDDRDSRLAVGEFLREMGHQVTECDNGADALELFRTEVFPMVLTDIRMPKMSGLELLLELAQLGEGQETDIVLFTGHGDMGSAISALRAGAYDYLLKPVNVEELASVTEKIMERKHLRGENNRVFSEHFTEKIQGATEGKGREISQLKSMLPQALGLDKVVFNSEKMMSILHHAYKYHEDRSIPVLIQGETGTGKEIIAKVIHYGKTAGKSPFIDINCAAVTANLFESELFGYEAGSYTGGLPKGQKGKLDLAEGGTLFLDEVGEIPLELQGKLLRVIQEKEFYRVGGLKKIKTNVRLICATNVDLEKRIEEGKFRRDLYFRLKVGHLVIPPLRERPDDILPLAGAFLQELSNQKRKSFQHIGKQAARILLDYIWPGNVRELRNVIEWAVFMYDDAELQGWHLHMLTDNKEISPKTGHFSLPSEGLSLREHVHSIILQALKMHQGNKAETARFLGMTRRSLYSHLERLKEETGVPFGTPDIGNMDIKVHK